MLHSSVSFLQNKNNNTIIVNTTTTTNNNNNNNNINNKYFNLYMYSMFASVLCRVCHVFLPGLVCFLSSLSVIIS